MNTIETTKKRSLLATAPQVRVTALATLLVATSSAFANLIPINVVPSSGNGIELPRTIVTFQNNTRPDNLNPVPEVGAIGLLPVGAVGVVRRGSTVAFGIGNGYPNAEGGTNELPGSSIYTTSGLGITATGTNTFANLVLLFNGSEGTNADDQAITLTNLSLNLFSPLGLLLGSYATVASYSATSFPGTAYAGFGFQLDATQAALANALFATTPNITIGVAARAVDAHGSAESISISRLDSVPTDPTEPVVPVPPGGGVGVPDGGTTVMMLGGALIGLTLLRRRVGRTV